MTQQLTINSLRDLFHVLDASWTVYRRKNGSIGCQPTSKAGVHNVGLAVAAGGKVLADVSGVSRREAILGVKRSGR